MELVLAVKRFQLLSLFSAFTPAYYLWVINPDVRETSLPRYRGGRCLRCEASPLGLFALRTLERSANRRLSKRQSRLAQ